MYVRIAFGIFKKKPIKKNLHGLGLKGRTRRFFGHGRNPGGDMPLRIFFIISFAVQSVARAVFGRPVNLIFLDKGLGFILVILVTVGGRWWEVPRAVVVLTRVSPFARPPRPI